MYARQDATRARNDIRTLTTFFKKYTKAVPAELASLGQLINDAESVFLNPQPKGQECAAVS
jgi:hypothetical protein